MPNHRATYRVVILADDSAHWKIAGLRQLDRIALAVKEICGREQSIQTVRFSVCWRPNTAKRVAARVSLDEIEQAHLADQRFDLVIPTRLLISRKCTWENLAKNAAVKNPNSSWEDLLSEGKAIWGTVQLEADGCEYLCDGANLTHYEKRFLRGSGKSSDDGFVSRYLNRPISRAISRALLKTPMTPNAWTFLITLLPLIGCAFLIRGDYAGFVTGALLYHLHSTLDGCDGEIARAKYLDSPKGPGIDALGDLIALLLFAPGLGIGLFRQAGGAAGTELIYLGEGILSFFLIADRLGRHTLDLLARGRSAVESSQHDRLLRGSGQHLIGARLTAFAFQLTKRDVVYFGFAILAILGLAAWILHILFVYSLASWMIVRQGRNKGIRSPDLS